MNMGQIDNIDKESILQCLYEKTYTCPVCDNIFKNKTVRTGRVRIVSTDIDLKPIYTPINPMLYSVVSCQLCGYTSLELSFERIGLKQSTIVRQALAPKFVAKSYPEIYDVNTAIVRHKLAFVCANLKKAKKSEFAYIALRLSWFYDDISNAGKANEYTQYAYNFFKEAYTTEDFPLFIYDENSATYLIGALAYKIGDIDEASKWTGNVILSKTVQSRIKQKALDLKELIKEKKC